VHARLKIDTEKTRQRQRKGGRGEMNRDEKTVDQQGRCHNHVHTFIGGPFSNDEKSEPEIRSSQLLDDTREAEDRKKPKKQDRARDISMK